MLAFRFTFLQLIAAVSFVITFAYFLLVPSWLPPSYVSHWQDVAQSAQATGNITMDIEVLKALEAPTTISFQRLCVTAREKHGIHRQSLVELPVELLDDSAFEELNLDAPDPEAESLLPSCQYSHEIEIPEFDFSHRQTNTAPLMLGVATTLSRIRDSLPTFSRWLSNTGSPLVCLLVDQRNLDEKRETVEEVHLEAAAMGIDLTLEPYTGAIDHDSEGLKNFHLALALDKNRRESTQWFGIIDDDTFFLSLPRMLEALGPYDPDELWYIGSLTEGHTRVAQEGFKAWGGAGFFISPPLMQTIAENFAKCIPLDKFFGDILWRDCILEVTSPTVQLTELRGLNQMDLWKDISGWYEAGWSSILTIHHWKSWHFFPVAKAHLVVDVTGPDSLFQRYLFGNNTVFTNGYSVVEYPLGLPDLNLVELTMSEDVNVRRPPEQLEFHHSMGRTRPALKVGTEKISWRFVHAVKTADNVVRQFYVKKNDDRQDFSVIEIDWKNA